MDNQKNLVIFDADSIIFLTALKFENKKAKHLVTLTLNKFIRDVISNCAGTHYIGFFGSKEDGARDNFRYTVYDKYKANRKDVPECVKKWGPAIRDEMKNKWGFMPIDGMEADDAASIAAYENQGKFDNIYVATMDKDLKQIPNVFFYNFGKHKSEYISDFEAERFLAVQTMMGDSTDNIPGIPGVGIKTAQKVISECDSKFSLIKTVALSYKNAFDKEILKLQKSSTKDIEKAIEKEYSDKGINLSQKQLDRKVKIANKSSADKVLDTFIGGWKNFMKMNYSLVRMLTSTRDSFCPTGFVVPDPIETDIKPKVKKVKVAKPSSNNFDNLDDDSDCGNIAPGVNGTTFTVQFSDNYCNDTFVL